MGGGSSCYGCDLGNIWFWDEFMWLSFRDIWLFDDDGYKWDYELFNVWWFWGLVLVLGDLVYSNN